MDLGNGKVGLGQWTDLENVVKIDGIGSGIERSVKKESCRGGVPGWRPLVPCRLRGVSCGPVDSKAACTAVGGATNCLGRVKAVCRPPIRIAEPGGGICTQKPVADATGAGSGRGGESCLRHRNAIHPTFKS